MTDDRETMRDVRHEPRADGVSPVTVWERGPEATAERTEPADD